MKKDTSEQLSATELQQCLPGEMLTKKSKELTGVKGSLLPADDISSLTPEEKEARLRRAKEALYKFLLNEARALVDANPSSFNKIH